MRERMRRVGRMVILVLVAGLCCCLFSAAALALSGGRVYEMVSPVYKGGYGALRIEAVAPDGDGVAFYSPGAFNGAPAGAEEFDYFARRDALSGWSTEPFMLPTTVAPGAISRDVSSTLDSTLASGKPGPNSEAAFQEGLEQEVWLHSPGSGDGNATWTSAGVVLKALNETPFGVAYFGGSADLCHLFFGLSNTSLLPQASEAANPKDQVYELDRGCAGGQPSLRVVGLNNSGKLVTPTCLVGLGTGEYTESFPSVVNFSAFNAVAGGGGEVFFESGVGSACVPHQLFVRLGGVRTLEVSRPLDVGGCVGEVGGVSGEVPCAGAASRASANFVGASGDGSKVFFTTKAPLVGADATNNLYMASIGCHAGEPGCDVVGRGVTSLTDVSADLNVGGSAEVQGAVRVASDGSRVYFVARGDLLSATQVKTLEGERRAVPHVGADNLYVYDTTGGVAFVADLCSGSGHSGIVPDQSCPSGVEGGSTAKGDAALWSSGNAHANSCRPGRSACDPGRFLVFSTYARLAASDTNEGKDVYRYDAVTGALVRVSGGEGGYHSDGNCEGSDSHGECDASIAEGQWGGTVRFQYEMGNRAVSEDGSRIVFKTVEPLSPRASNGRANVYEWHQASGEGEGTVSLVSSGSGEPVENVVISPEGADIFFVTTEGLVPQDTDGTPDIYDARLNGGFPSRPASAAPCKGDACQGPLTNPAPLLIPGSLSQQAGGNFTPAKTVSAKAKKSKAASKNRHKIVRKPKSARHAVHARHSRTTIRGRGQQ
jgi:hypothetical protein